MEFTEAEWLASDLALHMLRFVMAGAPALEGSYAGLGCSWRPSDRQLLLVAVSCQRTVPEIGLAVPHASATTEVLEQWAEAGECPLSGGIIMPGFGLWPERRMTPFDAADQTLQARVIPPAARRDWGPADRPARCAAVLRDVIGNPFRRLGRSARGVVTLKEFLGFGLEYAVSAAEGFWGEWDTPLVLSLARAAYDERHGDGQLVSERLLVLSDALEESGCASVPLLSHLRDAGLAHHPGCWALDLVLGRS